MVFIFNTKEEENGIMIKRKMRKIHNLALKMCVQSIEWQYFSCLNGKIKIENKK